MRLIVLPLLIVPLIAQAQGLVPCGGEGKPPCNSCHLLVMFQNIFNFAVWKLIPTLAVLFIGWGGFRFLLSGEDPKHAQEGKEIIKHAFVGLIIAFGGWMLVNVFFQLIGISEFTNEWFNPMSWWRISCEMN